MHAASLPSLRGEGARPTSLRDMGGVVSGLRGTFWHGRAPGHQLRVAPRGSCNVTSLRCGCGRWHADASRLAKLGWLELGRGEFAMLVRCPCGSKLTAARIADASKCDVCKRVVTGSEGDLKVCVADDRGARVVCDPCFRRGARRAQWVHWTQWVP
jgi:hypothetical protein